MLVPILSFIGQYYFIIFFAVKNLLFGVKIFFPDSSQKTNATLWPSFFDIFASFGVKNVWALLREIE